MGIIGEDIREGERNGGKQRKIYRAIKSIKKKSKILSVH